MMRSYYSERLEWPGRYVVDGLDCSERLEWLRRYVVDGPNYIDDRMMWLNYKDHHIWDIVTERGGHVTKVNAM